jgi:hypothetical protein
MPAEQAFEAPVAEQVPVFPSQPQPQPQPQKGFFSGGTDRVAIGMQQDELLLDLEVELWLREPDMLPLEELDDERDALPELDDEPPELEDDEDEPLDMGVLQR